MTKRSATTWIKHDITTGSTKPWEVYFQAEGGKVYHVSSCMNEEKAIKSQKSLIKRSLQSYDIKAI